MRGRLTTIHIDLRLTLLGLALAVVCGVAAGAKERAVAARNGLEAKLLYCKTCHGLQAQGYRGYFPMPRLAGQQPQYLDVRRHQWIFRPRERQAERSGREGRSQLPHVGARLVMRGPDDGTFAAIAQA